MKQTPKSLFPYYEKVDLSYREEWREYIFPNGERVRIDSPQYLIVSDNGHRVMDNRIAHYIPYGWIELIWYPKGGYDFYCERSDEIDSPEDKSKIRPPYPWPDPPGGVVFPPFNSSGLSIEKSNPPENEDFDKTMGNHINETISSLSNAFLRFMRDQLDNADHNKNTIEYQTLGKVENKFLDLFQSWIGKQNEQEEEPEQSSTESTE